MLRSAVAPYEVSVGQAFAYVWHDKLTKLAKSKRRAGAGGPRGSTVDCAPISAVANVQLLESRDNPDPETDVVRGAAETLAMVTCKRICVQAKAPLTNLLRTLVLRANSGVGIVYTKRGPPGRGGGGAGVVEHVALCIRAEDTLPLDREPLKDEGLKLLLAGVRRETGAGPQGGKGYNYFMDVDIVASPVLGSSWMGDDTAIEMSALEELAREGSQPVTRTSWPVPLGAVEGEKAINGHAVQVRFQMYMNELGELSVQAFIEGEGGVSKMKTFAPTETGIMIGGNEEAGPSSQAY